MLINPTFYSLGCRIAPPLPNFSSFSLRGKTSSHQYITQCKKKISLCSLNENCIFTDMMLESKPVTENTFTKKVLIKTIETRDGQVCA